MEKRLFHVSLNSIFIDIAQFICITKCYSFSTRAIITGRIQGHFMGTFRINTPFDRLGGGVTRVHRPGLKLKLVVVNIFA